MEKFTTDDKAFTFEVGKSYYMKFKRTTMCFLYEPKNNWYRLERKTNKNQDVEGYILRRELSQWYNYLNNEDHANGKIKVIELDEVTIKEHNAFYNNWEINKEEERKAKFKAYKKKGKKYS